MEIVRRTRCTCNCSKASSAFSKSKRMSNESAVGAVRRAVIDVGTNSVKLLVGDVKDGLITPVFEDSKQTRLGAGLYTEHRLQPEAIAKTAQAISKYAIDARQ